MKGNVNSRWGRRPASGRRGRHAAKSRLSRLLALFSAVAISGGVMVALAPAASADPSETVSFCHRTNAADSANNPYNAHINQSIDSLNGHTDKNNNGSHTLRGDHQGPVWSLGMKAANEPWGDIIEPNSWFPRGYNWYIGDSGYVPNVAGQEFLKNGCKIPSASLSLEKIADPTLFAAASTPITYTFKVTNTGESTITDLAIDDFYFTGKAGPLDPITCKDRVLAPSADTSCSATYNTTGDDVAAATSIRNTARAVGESLGRTVTSNNSSAVVTFDGEGHPVPGYELWKTSVADWDAGTITYTLHMQRTSSVTVTGAGASDPLPSEVTLESGPTLVAGSTDNNAGSVTVNGTIIEWTDVTLGSSAIATATFTVKVTADPGTAILNIAEIPAGNGLGKCRTAGTTNLCETTDTVPQPKPEPLWWIKKTASPSDLVTDGTITYTLTAMNQGGEVVSEGQAVDTLPAGVSVDGSSLAPELEYDSSSHSLTWTFDLGTEAGNRTATVDYKVTVTAGAGATLVNAITHVSAGGQCEPTEKPSAFRGASVALIPVSSDDNANCVTTNRTPADSSTSTPPADTGTDTPADTGTPEVQGESNVEPEAVTPPQVLGVSQELPPAPVIKVKPAAQVAPAPSANAHTGQGQSPWAYLLFGAGALLLLGAWRVRRNGNA